MEIIGITGGAGAGKSVVLQYLRERYGAHTIQADQVGHELMEPWGSCYLPILELLGKGILDGQGRIDRREVAKLVFPQPALLARLNAIVHPAVKNEICRRMEEERQQGRNIFVVEAALLLEDHYDAICGDIWYIRAGEDVRRQRLKGQRGYSDEKITDIFKNQKTDGEFLQKCNYVVENNGDLQVTYGQIDRRMEQYGFM